MNIYDAVKASVSCKDAAQRYGLKIERKTAVPEYWASCPFGHRDDHPSLALYGDHYHCFSCQNHGNVLDLVAKLEGLTIVEAARTLASDFAIEYTGWTPADAEARAERKKKWQEAIQEKQAAQKFFYMLCNYIHELKEWCAVLAPKDPAEEWSADFAAVIRQKAELEEMADRWLEADQAVKIQIMKQYEDGF